MFPGGWTRIRSRSQTCDRAGRRPFHCRRFGLVRRQLTTGTSDITARPGSASAPAPLWPEGLAAGGDVPSGTSTLGLGESPCPSLCDPSAEGEGLSLWPVASAVTTWTQCRPPDRDSLSVCDSWPLAMSTQNRGARTRAWQPVDSKLAVSSTPPPRGWWRAPAPSQCFKQGKNLWLFISRADTLLAEEPLLLTENVTDKSQP